MKQVMTRLWNELKVYGNINGIGIQSDSDGEFIMVYKVSDGEEVIPEVYEGIRVKVEVIGEIRLQS